MQFSNFLKEISETSAKNAASALSKFLKTHIDVNIKPIEINTTSELDFFIDPEELAVKLFVPVTGQLSGYSFFLFTKESALLICDLLLNKEYGTTKTLTEIEQSGLSELANIVIGNFLATFAQSLHRDYVMQRPADFSIGSFANIYHQIQLTFTKSIRREVVVKISFEYQNERFKGYVVFVFEVEQIDGALKEIFEKNNKA